LLLAVLLMLTIFTLLYFLITGELPAQERVKPKKIAEHAIPLAIAAVFFTGGSLVFMSPLSGFLSAVLGWLLVAWLKDYLNKREYRKIKEGSRDFISSATALLRSGLAMPEVINKTAAQLKPPLSEDFQAMYARYEMAGSKFPKMFKDLAAKYGVQEFDAISSIVSATEYSGGGQAAAKGFARLGSALRKRDKLLAERAKETMEPMIAAWVVIVMMLAGIVVDVTFLRDMFQDAAAKLVLSAALALTLLMLVMARKLGQSKDLD